jgi:hypothetical protein
MVYISPSTISVSPILAPGAAFNVIPPWRRTLIIFLRVLLDLWDFLDPVVAFGGRFCGGITKRTEKIFRLQR